MKKLVMNKYSTVAFGDEDELAGNEEPDRSPLELTPEATVESDEDSIDDEERAEIRRLKTQQTLELQRLEEIEAMQRAMDPASASDGEDLPMGLYRAESEKKWNAEQMRKQKKEMQDAMAHLVANSQTFNADDFDGIKMVSVEQPHADEMEDRVNALAQMSISEKSVDLKQIVMHKYSTVAYGDEADMETEDEGAMGDIAEETDRDSESSESLDETEKAHKMRQKSLTRSTAILISSTTNLYPPCCMQRKMTEACLL